MPDPHYVDTVAESRRAELSRLDVLLKRLQAENRKLRDELADTRFRLARFIGGARN